jgi:hypothetical protein
MMIGDEIFASERPALFHGWFSARTGRARLIKRAYGSKNQFTVSHSRSFVHLLRPPPLRTAIAITRRCPTMTTRRLPRVTAV